MLRNRYWFNLETSEWEAKRFPPNNLYVAENDNMYFFRGKPTLFGNPICTTEGGCEYLEVDQYDPDSNKWIKLGNLLENKGLQTVVEVLGISPIWLKLFDSF